MWYLILAAQQIPIITFAIPMACTASIDNHSAWVTTCNAFSKGKAIVDQIIKQQHWSVELVEPFMCDYSGTVACLE